VRAGKRPSLSLSTIEYLRIGAINKVPLLEEVTGDSAEYWLKRIDEEQRVRELEVEKLKKLEDGIDRGELFPAKMVDFFSGGCWSLGKI